MSARFFWVLPLLTALSLAGFGCARDTSYVPARSEEAPTVAPSLEGSRASTGGQSTTVTPSLPTERLVAALPGNGGGWVASQAIEAKNPIPLPDGTRTEYPIVTRSYHRANGGPERITATIADTRGLPALTTFLDGYAVRETEAGFRTRIPIGEQGEGWLSYTYGPNREMDGIGTVVLLYRDRFLIQLDGNQGVSSEALAQLTERFAFSELH